MKIKLILLSGALILIFANSVYGTLVQLEDAYELSMNQVRLPRHDGGQLVVRECPTCDATVLRIDKRTRYYLGRARTPVPLDDLLTAAHALGTRKDNAVYVFFQPEEKIVTRIILDDGS